MRTVYIAMDSMLGPFDKPGITVFKKRKDCEKFMAINDFHTMLKRIVIE